MGYLSFLNSNGFLVFDFDHIYTIKDLQDADPFILKREFKKIWSEWLHAVAWGYDEREIISEYTEKSIGRSCTLEKNTKDWAWIKNTIIDLIKIVCYTH